MLHFCTKNLLYEHLQCLLEYLYVFQYLVLLSLLFLLFHHQQQLQHLPLIFLAFLLDLLSLHSFHPTHIYLLRYKPFFLCYVHNLLFFPNHYLAFRLLFLVIMMMFPHILHLLHIKKLFLLFQKTQLVLIILVFSFNSFPSFFLLCDYIIYFFKYLQNILYLTVVFFFDCILILLPFRPLYDVLLCFHLIFLLLQMLIQD